MREVDPLGAGDPLVGTHDRKGEDVELFPARRRGRRGEPRREASAARSQPLRRPRLPRRGRRPGAPRAPRPRGRRRPGPRKARASRAGAPPGGTALPRRPPRGGEPRARVSAEAEAESSPGSGEREGCPAARPPSPGASPRRPRRAPQRREGWPASAGPKWRGSHGPFRPSSSPRRGRRGRCRGRDARDPWSLRAARVRTGRRRSRNAPGSHFVPAPGLPGNSRRLPACLNGRRAGARGRQERATRYAPSRLTIAAVAISSSRSARAHLPLIRNGSRTGVSENLRTVPRLTRFRFTFPIRHVAKRRSPISA